MLKGMVTDIVGDIMDNIRKQILQKMKQLDVIIKEPLHRRASHDDYNLCFENFNKKSTIYTFGDVVSEQQAIFTSNPNLIKSRPQKKGKKDDDDTSSSSIFSQKSQY